jgi:FkbM family methyltransferase
LKDKIIYILQRIFGFDNYLFIFAIFVIIKLRWDKNERDFLRIFSLIPKEGIVLDIGANIGVMTTFFSRKLPKAKVYSFEPIPQNNKALKRIIRFLKLRNVTVFDFALGNKQEQLCMIMPVVNDAKKQGLSHIKADSKSTRDEKGEEFEVQVNTLDEMPEIINAKASITAIKIDVEGFELNVFKGAEKMLLKHHPIIYCELWPGDDQLKTIHYLQSLNYSPKVIVRNTLVDFTGQRVQNFFFV